MKGMIMMVLKSDFYYGALLINLIKENFAPAIIESGDERQVYELASDHGDYIIFAKYRGSKQGNAWNFVFTSRDVARLKSLGEEENSVIVALVCGDKKLNDSEIAYVTYDELQRVIHFNEVEQHLTIRAKSNARFFEVYSGVYDPARVLRVRRDEGERLKELVNE